jgi:hypothetical protein
MPIRQSVENMGALPTSLYQAFAAQEPEPLGHRGKLFVEGGDKLRDAAFALPEIFQETQTRSIAQGTKKSPGSFQGLRGTGSRGLGKMLVGITFGDRARDSTPLFHYFTDS